MKEGLEQSIFSSIFHYITNVIDEHQHFVIGRNFKHEHNLIPSNLRANFKILKKCRSKLKKLIFEMLLIRKKRPRLKVTLLTRKFLFVNFSFKIVIITLLKYSLPLGLC